jgi:imidazolonepropionase-like amidohydrolase
MRSSMLVTFAACICALAEAETAPVTAFVDVHVIPMDRERVLDHQTVIVRGTRIDKVGPMHDIRVPGDAAVINGHGTEYLLPGLADMHTHVMRAEDLLPYTANSVTTILHMGGAPAGFVDHIRESIDSGAVTGPQIFFAFMIDGSAAIGRFYVRTPEQARAAVLVAKANGYSFMKAYNNLTAAEFDAIVDEGRRQGLPVIGHGVRAVGLPKALFEGQVMVAHAEEFFYTAFANHVPTDPAIVNEVVDQTFRSGAYVTPTLSTFATIAKQWGNAAELRIFLQDPRIRFMSPDERVDWSDSEYVRRHGDLASILAFLRTFTKALSDRGVPLLAGTDSPVIPGLLPGYSLHEDLQELTAAGLTPYQALAAATRTPGEFVARYVPDAMRFGEIQQGMRADVIVVAENPLDSISALEHPLGVMSAGRWRTREQLDALLEGVRAKYDAVLK